MIIRVIAGLVGAGLVLIGLASAAAFEAHVVNVTAHIENALGVSTQELDFGTVFPQEYLEETFNISLSSSFLEQSRLTNVNYEIKQKPKPIWPEPTECNQSFTTIDEARSYCHANPNDQNCCYLSLCPYLSKLDGDPEDTNDISVPSYFRDTFCGTPDPDTASGELVKGSDATDIWKVDLKVPPIEGFVGQEWPDGCPTVAQDAQDYGCDLWIEVTGFTGI